MREHWLAFRALSLAGKILSFAAVLVFVGFAGFLSGLLLTIRAGALFRSGPGISIIRCLQKGFLTGRGLLVTAVLLILASILIMIMFNRRRDRVQVESEDPDTGTRFADRGTMGSDKWMTPEEAREAFDCGDVRELFGFIYGKLRDGTDDAVTFYGSKLGDGNRNNVILGNPGTGKSHNIIRNELIQAIRRRESFVCTDPSGELYRDTFSYCRERCDKVYVLNFKDPDYSSAWNCAGLTISRQTGRVDAVRLQTFASTYLVNATTESPEEGNFWFEGAYNIFQAIIGLYAYEHEEYIRDSLMRAIQTIFDAQGLNEEVPPQIRLDKMYSLVKAEKLFRKCAKNVLSEAETERTIRQIQESAPPFSIAQVYYEIIRLQDGNYEEISKRFSLLPHRHPAWSCFQTFSSASVDPKVKASMLQGLAQRMSPLRSDALRRTLSHDELDLMDINKKLCAVYLVIPDNKDTFRALIALFFKFMFDDLSDEWDDTDAQCMEKGLKTLDYLHPVSVVMDEFFAIGTVPGFPNFISSSRKRKLNITLAVQNIGQINLRYGDDGAATILNCCDTVIFLGTNDPATAEWMSTFILGIATTIVQSYSQSEGRYVIARGMESVTESQQQRYLMYVSELRKFKGYVLIAQSGKNPLKLGRFSYQEHPESRWFRAHSLQKTVVPVSRRFAEEDPFAIADLKHIQDAYWEEEQMKAQAEGRPAVFRPLILDKSASAAENRNRILQTLRQSITGRMEDFRNDGYLDLDGLEAEEAIDLEELTEEPEEKEPVIDSTFREVERPKKPKNRRKKNPGRNAAQRPSDHSELNDD